MYRLYLDTVIKGKHDLISSFQNIYCMTRSNWMRSQKDFCIILFSKQSKRKDNKLSRSTKKQQYDMYAQRGLRSAWVCSQCSEKMCLMSYANNKGADQSAHPRSLISAFVVRCLDSIIYLGSIAEISRT